MDIPDAIPIYTKIPCSAKDVEWLWKAVIVYKASIDGKQSHQQDNIATIKNGLKHLKRKLNFVGCTHHNKVTEVKNTINWKVRDIEDITCLCVDMDFIFECSTRYLARSLRSLMRWEDEIHIHKWACNIVYHINILMTMFSMIFRRFSTTFRRFPKIFQNCSE